MRGILRPLRRLYAFNEVVSHLRNHKSQQAVFGLFGSLTSYFFAGLAEELCDLPVLIITPGEREAGRLVEELSWLLPSTPVRLFPVLQIIPCQVLAQSKEVAASRLAVLEDLAAGKRLVIVAPAEAVLRRLVPPDVFREQFLRLAQGSKVGRESLLRRLADLGYERVDTVEGRGQFACRGGILDVFPMTAARPFRIELFDEEIDSIRRFNVSTQRSEENTSEVLIGPAREAVVPPQLWEKGLEAACGEYLRQVERLKKKGDFTALRQLKEGFAALDEGGGAGIVPEHFLPYFYQKAVTILDYLPSNTPVLVDDFLRFYEVVNFIQRERAETYTILAEKGRILPSQFKCYAGWEDLQSALRAHRCVYTSLLPRRPDFLQLDREVYVTSRSLPDYSAAGGAALAAEVGSWRRDGYAVVVLVAGRQRGQQLAGLMAENGVEAFFAANPEGHIRPGNVLITTGALREGFDLPQARFAVISESAVLSKTRKSPARRPRTEKLAPFVDLKAGDYVVHTNHGIGRYLGVVPLSIGGIQKEYLLIKYAGEDKLYVPVDQVGLIQKYLGGEGEAPRLSRLGGSDWARVKSRVKEAVREMAGELLALYAARETIRGHAFGPDTVWQKEFEDSFPYEETPDQLRAVEEVKADMEKPRPMDRLLCGDVGYGKTEIALRAAFKAVVDGKQVAVLVPTTILAQQHFYTFKERLAGYPVNVEVLSRFKSPREQRRILEGLAKGTVDIIIGTHRLLQEDVRFKDLGLLVVDEEQRFGVAHKERLKMLRRDVDVLTLTATPIPRTLHMSLVGVRDTSILETPPEDRYPVQTYVLEEDPVLIREAIRRELGREGQVFFVYNRVMELERVTAWLRELVPEARIAMAHGQMGEDELEQVMIDFINRKYDVLVCTTIIENGLDIPNVNTLIVKEADMMGLAQLYQLRGRVGRSNRVAYAYFTFRRDKILKEAAEKRLSAIREFTELGSGFKIAMRDLEIRGAGNILGAEQHGHIAAVGFDLYCRLLEEAVREARGEEIVQPPETVIELPVEAYIPASYIPDERQKVEIYRRIAGLTSEEELDELAGELLDRFGDMPPCVQNLLAVAGIKILAGRLRAKSISYQTGLVRLVFAQGHSLTGEALVAAGEKYRHAIKYSHAGGEFEIKLRLSFEGGQKTRELLDILGELLRVLLERKGGTCPKSAELIKS